MAGQESLNTHTQKKAANGAAGQVEGLLSEWIHLEWKNRRERLRQHCSDELPQADVELAVLLRRVLLWGYPVLQVRTARCAEVGIFFHWCFCFTSTF